MLGITPQTERSATATEFINQFVLVRSCRLAVVEGLLYRYFGPVRCASRVLSLLASIDRVARSAAGPRKYEVIMTNRNSSQLCQ